MEIRTVNRNDYQKIDALIRNTFTHTENGYGNETELVDTIRKSQEYIRDLEIVAIEEGKGIGKKLMEELEKRAKHLDYPFIYFRSCRLLS
ncbi:hypothetical protein [Enterococcus sp. AZ126]|uniref:hypothetical protein n=1 Tax=Enterococcus sp. AZ126 TaxID=2774635 RepID=UPI003F28DF72